MWFTANLCQIHPSLWPGKKLRPSHCNILLPFNTLTRTLEEGRSKPKKPVPVAQEETDTDSSLDSSKDEVDEQSVEQPAIPRYMSRDM